MIPLLSVPKIPLALLLPISFMWVFAACVLSCSERSLEAVDHHAQVSGISLAGELGCEDCPIAKAPTFGLPARHSYPIQIDDSQSMFVPVALANSRDVCSATPWMTTDPLASPPLERLRVLRI
jgi:hypothetical protein